MKRLLVLMVIAVGAQAAELEGPWKALKYPPLKPLTFPKVEEADLPNGIHLVLLETHDLPLVRGTAIVRTGNLFDPADKVGLAGITGTVIRTGGTVKKSGDQIDVELENVAASVEANIGESFGTVSFSCLKENTAEVMATFHDVLTAPGFRNDKIELAKAQTRSGISRRNDEASEVAGREFTNLLYGHDTPYGWNIEYSTISNIKRDDVVGFYKRYFFPKNVILAVSGDFDAVQMKQQVTAMFADWTVEQPKVPEFPKVNFQYKPGTYIAVKGDVTQTSFLIGEPGGVLSDPDYPALEVLSHILGGGFDSRLFKRIRTQLGLVYGISAGWGANYDHPGLFEISGSTKSASTVDAIEAAIGEFKRVRTELVTKEELRGAKETVLNSFVFNFDTPAKTLNRLVTYQYFGYPKDFIFQYQKAVEAVTREDVLRVAKKYLDVDKLAIVAVGNPAEFGKGLDALGSKPVPIDLTIPAPVGGK